jgi:hypothetical protein
MCELSFSPSFFLFCFSVGLHTSTSYQDFIVWIKTNVLQNNVVIIGIYENSAVFGQSPDPDYDHIVPVIGWGSNHALTDLSYYDDDVIYFSDNGLYTPDGKDPVYKMSYTVQQFGNSRKAADTSSAPVYSLNSAPTVDDPNFGIAITGVVDEESNCLPTRVDTNVNYESPEIQDKSNIRPTPMALVLTVTASGLTVGQSYNMYQYNDFDSVPSSQFNANSGNAAEKYTFTANATTYEQVVNIQSDQITVFRTVSTSAP